MEGWRRFRSGIGIGGDFHPRPPGRFARLAPLRLSAPKVLADNFSTARSESTPGAGGTLVFTVPPSAREGFGVSKFDDTVVLERAGLFLETVRSGTGLGMERVCDEAIFADAFFRTAASF